MGQENCLKGNHEYAGQNLNSMRCIYCGKTYDALAALEQRVKDLEDAKVKGDLR